MGSKAGAFNSASESWTAQPMGSGSGRPGQIGVTWKSSTPSQVTITVSPAFARSTKGLTFDLKTAVAILNTLMWAEYSPDVPTAQVPVKPIGQGVSPSGVPRPCN